MSSNTKQFHLVRTSDISGISGVGTVVEGIQFSDGSCVLRWLSDASSVGCYKSIEDVVLIHGHDGATTVAWVDNDVNESELREQVAKEIEASGHSTWCSNYHSQPTERTKHCSCGLDRDAAIARGMK